MKKIVSLILALMLLCSLSITCFATEAADPAPIDNTTPQLGSITINGINAEGNTLTTENIYRIYRILKLESYDTKSGAYSYKAADGWADFFATPEAKEYFTVGEGGYITWAKGEDTTGIADFAKLALAYAKGKNINPDKSSENPGDFVISKNDNTGIVSGKFSGLELGYYLIDSTMGALCGLTTTNPDAAVNAKNHAPTIDKQVKEDSTSQWVDINTADIGQIVEFRVTINVHEGAENFVLHDKMSDGFTYQEVTKVEHIIPGATADLTVTHTATLGTDYTVVTDTADGEGCTFEVNFAKEFCDHLKTNDKIVVYYKGMLNRYAIIAGQGNDNTAWLTFGEYNSENVQSHTTQRDSTATKTYKFDIVKTDDQNNLLKGATFKIYDAVTGGNEIAVVPLMDADDKTPVLDGNGNPKYRRARSNETGVEIKCVNGVVTVVGFDNGIYYLEEVTPPAGYNRLATRKEFTIADSNLDSIFNGAIYSTGSGVHVINKTGSMLPETGGLGTLLFTLLGGGTALGTGVVLVTKKRMSKIED